MRRSVRLAGVAVLMWYLSAGFAQTADPAPSFAPFEQWKNAVLSGDAAALKALYSTDPAVQIRIDGVARDAEADTSFWLGLKPRSINVQVVRNEPRHGHISFIFRAEVISGMPDGRMVALTDDQSWQQQDKVWRLISVELTDAPRLKQPSSMKNDIYPANADAHAEVTEAEERAAREHKRLLLVFGANWCFDATYLTWRFSGQNWRRSWPQTMKWCILISARRKKRILISFAPTRFR